MASARPRVVTFLSDYGTADEFVGLCHAVIARIAPDVRMIDLAHGVRGIRAGAATLAQSVSFAPDQAVHLAIVDPEVGTSRRALAVRTASGAVLVGPDNGLLVDAAHVLGGAGDAVELIEAAYRLEPVSATFHGRDIFAPAAAHLALGVELREFGPDVDLASLVRLPPSRVIARDGELESEVLRHDAFGNVQLAAAADDLARARLGAAVRIVAGSSVHGAAVGRTFADVPPGGLVVLIDAADHVAIAANLADAAERLGSPSSVRIVRAD